MERRTDRPWDNAGRGGRGGGRGGGGRGGGGRGGARPNPGRGQLRSPAAAPTPPPAISFPGSLLGLLEEAQARQAAGHTQHDVLQWIRCVAEHFELKLREERVDAVVAEKGKAESVEPAAGVPVVEAPVEMGAAEPPATETVAAPKSKRAVPAPIHRDADGNTFLVLEEICSPASLETATARVAAATPKPVASEPDVRRIVLGHDGRNARIWAPICSECNGVVVDARTWTLLALPPRGFGPRPREEAVDAPLAQGVYDVIPVQDGTIVTLFPWGDGPGPHTETGGCSGAWSMSTANAYDVSGLRWTGPRTYAEVFLGVAQLYPELVEKAGLRLEGGRLFAANLRRDRCFTVGFRSAEFHPLGFDPPAMWQIQFTRLIGENSPMIYGVVPSSAEQSDLPGVPWQPLADGKFQSFRAIRESLADSIAGAKAMAQAWAADSKAVGTPAYGYLLRSRDPSATGRASDILVESPLLNKIRHFLYDRPPRHHGEHLVPENRVEYHLLRSYLFVRDRETLVALFPQFREKFNAFESFIASLVALIVDLHRERSLNPPARRPAPAAAAPKDASSALMTIARMFLDEIMNHGDIPQAFNANTARVVRDFVESPQFVIYYLLAMKKSATA